MGASDWFKSIKGLFSASEERESAQETFVKAWELQVEGEITEWKKTNVDKSGRNPRYHVYGMVAVKTSELRYANFKVPADISFQGKEAEVQTAGMSPVSVGDRVKLLFKGTDVPSGRFVLNQILHHA